MERIYQEDVYARRFTAHVAGVEKIEENIADITLDRTCFFPEGGGQSSDTGTINGMQVLDVQEYRDTVRHRVFYGDHLPQKGDEVTGIIDWDHRFDNMQRHCGEHILSGAFDRAFGGVNRGFHMGEDFMTIDIRLEKDSSFTKITSEMVEKAEEMANSIIWEDLPVTVSRFDSRTEAEKMPVRKKVDFEKDISIVLIGSRDDPADCVACCGTHPSSTGQVGLVKIYKTEKNKDMFRIYFEAGRRAMQNYSEEHRILTGLGLKYSSGIPELPEKLSARDEKENEMKQRMDNLSRIVVDSKVSLIDASKGFLFDIDPLTADDGMRIGKKSRKPFLALLIRSSNMLLLFSDGSVDCGALVKESGLKGGGRAGSARAIGSSEELRGFIEKLKAFVSA